MAPFDPEVISAIAEGLRSGVDSYRQERDYQDRKKRQQFDDQLKAQQFKLGLKQSGYLPDQGAPTGFVETPEHEQERKTGLLEKQAGLMQMGIQPQWNPETRQMEAKPVGGGIQGPGGVPGLGMIGGIKGLQMRKEQQELQNITPGMRPIPAGEAKDLGDIRAAPGLVNEMQDAIERNAHMMGPIAGRINALNPTNTEAQKFDTQLKLASEKIGKSIHVNRLSDTEQARVQAMLPHISDTPDVAKARLEALRDYIKNHWETQVGGLEDAGFDVSAFKRRGLGLLPGSSKPVAPAQSVQGKVKVSDGKTSYYIDAADLKHAQAEGFKVVK